MKPKASVAEVVSLFKAIYGLWAKRFELICPVVRQGDGFLSAIVGGREVLGRFYCVLFRQGPLGKLGKSAPLLELDRGRTIPNKMTDTAEIRHKSHYGWCWS